jgi:hypothetical protein
MHGARFNKSEEWKMRILQSKWVKIRKPHNCFGCCQNYSAGSKMHYWVGVIDEEFNYTYTCQICNIIIENNPSEFDDGFLQGQISDFCNEYPEELKAALKELLK